MHCCFCFGADANSSLFFLQLWCIQAGIALGELTSLSDLYDTQSIALLFLIGVVSVTPALLGKDEAQEKPSEMVVGASWSPKYNVAFTSPVYISIQNVVASLVRIDRPLWPETDGSHGCAAWRDLSPKPGHCPPTEEPVLPSSKTNLMATHHIMNEWTWKAGCPLDELLWC